MKPPFFVAPLLTLLAQDSDAPGRQARLDQTLLRCRERESLREGERERERRCVCVSVLREEPVGLISREAWTATHASTVSPTFAAHHPQQKQGDRLKPSQKPSVLPAVPIFTVFGVAVVIGLIALASKWRDRTCPASFALYASASVLAVPRRGS